MLSKLSLSVILTFLLLTMSSISKDYKAYNVFEKGGDREDFEELVDDALDADIILFGEIHNNPIVHWLQLELAKELHKEDSNLVIGAEMFETDDQMVIDEYFADFFSTSNFEKEVKLWNNYSTDYKPVLEFAKKNNLKYVATNIPRRYASVVARQGLAALDSLNEDAKKLYPAAPIPFDPELPGYKKMVEQMGGAHGMAYIAEAQAVKDATMAASILKYYKNGHKFLHLNGTYHSDNFEGIYWYLKKWNPNLKILTISTVIQDDIDELKEESENNADYIIAVPSDMTTTY